jgi:tetratricopeptide (TPR) repeat protein
MGIVDLPAPKAVAKPREPEPFTLDGVDLVAPVGPTPRATPGAPIDAPKATARGPFTDLPAPKVPAPIVDLPAPKGPPAIADLPAPKRPAAGIVDLPAPDLPRPRASSTTSPARSPTAAPSISPRPRASSTTSPAPPPPRAAPTSRPRASSTTSPAPPPHRVDLPAPKGFFDDLPGPATASRGTDLAPKGFFDDLPAPRPSPRARAPRAASEPAPPAISLFDDLPPPSIPRADRFVAPPAPSGTPTLDGIDLPSGNSGMIELEPTSAGARAGSMAPAPARHQPASEPPPALELGDDGLGLDLPVTAAQMSHGSSGGAGSVVSFKAGAQGAAEATRYTAAPTGDIDLAVERREPAAARTRAPAAVDKPAKPGKLSPRATRILLAAVLGVTAVGAGGFVMYRKWDAQKTRAADLDRNLQAARKAMMANERGHWRRATRAANDVLQLDKKHPEALGIAAEAALASLLEDGTDAESRTAVARRHLETASAAGARHATLDKARALRELVEGTPAEAVTTLTPLAARADTDASLFLGWAQAQAGDFPAAITAFTAALTARPVPATYGLAQAQAGSGDTAAAHATLPEGDRARSRARRRAGRRGADRAGERSRQARGVAARDLAAQGHRPGRSARGGAGVDPRRRRGAARRSPRRGARSLPQGAGDLAARSRRAGVAGRHRAGRRQPRRRHPGRRSRRSRSPPTTSRPTSPAPRSICASGKASDTATRLSALREHKPPITAPGAAVAPRHDRRPAPRAGEEPRGGARRVRARGHGDRRADVGPIIAAAMLLGRMAVAADAAGKVPEAVALRVRADAKLVQIAAAAEHRRRRWRSRSAWRTSPRARRRQAERWLRSAIEKRPTEVEAHYQLAEALRRQGKQDEAVATLVKAFELDPTRLDLGVELARGFEAARRDADAAELYKKLLRAAKDVTVETKRARRPVLRAHQATSPPRGKLGDELLAVTPDDRHRAVPQGRGPARRRALQRGAPADAGGDQHATPTRSSSTALGRRQREALGADRRHRGPRRGAARLRAGQQARRGRSSTPGPAPAGSAWLRGEYDKALAAFEEALKKDRRAIPTCPTAWAWPTSSSRIAANAIAWLSQGGGRQAARRRVLQARRRCTTRAIARGAAASALERATALATKDERDDGVTVPWLTDALWLLGTVQQVLHNDGATIRAWEAYLARTPKNQAQAEEVRRYLTARGR